MVPLALWDGEPREYPELLTMISLLRPIASGWPFPLSPLLTLGPVVSLMTWLIMPLLTVRLGPWLPRP